MQTLASPCSAQERLRNILEAMPPVRQTSAGHRIWQTGQRDVVRLSSSSVSLSGEANMILFSNSDSIALEIAAKATQRVTRNHPATET